MDLSQLYKELSEEQGIPEAIVRHIVLHQFRYTKNKLQSEEMPEVRLHYLGVFKVKLGRLNFIIRAAIKRYRKGKISRQECFVELEKFFKLRRKLKSKQ